VENSIPIVHDVNHTHTRANSIVRTWSSADGLWPGKVDQSTRRTPHTRVFNTAHTPHTHTYFLHAHTHARTHKLTLHTHTQQQQLHTHADNTRLRLLRRIHTDTMWGVRASCPQVGELMSMQCLGNTPFAPPRLRLIPWHHPSSYSITICTLSPG